MKKLLLTLFLSAAAVTASAEVTHARKWNDDWLFRKADSDSFAVKEYVDTAWRQLTLPHDWSIEGIPSPTLASCTGYLPGGVAWYRKHFDFDRSAAGDSLTKVYFEGIYNRSDIYLNGNRVGGRPNGYVSTEYDLTPYLVDGDNVMAVRVDHSRHADSRWYTGSGIYRDAWIYTKPARHIALWGVSYDAKPSSRSRWNVDVSVEMQGPASEPDRLTAVITDHDGKTVARKSITSRADTATLRLTIADAKLWNLDDPCLYSLQVTLSQGGRTVDSETVPLGLRTVSFDADKGFTLNGKPMKLKGVCIHHDAGAVGAAVPPVLVRQRLEALKAMGANAIRCSHNPQAPIFYHLCDSLGLMVMDEASDEWEFPKRKWIEGWNKGTPGYDGTADFFEEWIERDVTDMVRRDRTHPSVILWSVGNEVDYPNDPYSHPILDQPDDSGMTQHSYGGYDPEAPRAERIGAIAGRLAAAIRRHDPTRPTTGALAGVVMSNCTSYPDAIDVVGYNYTESRYAADHATYPRRIIYGSENRSDYEAWKAVRDNDFISGQFIWTGADYLGESGAWPSRGLNTGLLDFTNRMKPRGKFRASLWSDAPVAYLGAYPATFPGGGRGGMGRPRRHNFVSIDAPANWTYADSALTRIVCYTNLPQARLLLDGEEYGPMASKNDSTGVIYWDLPYKAGVLVVEACDATGAPAATDTLYTTTRPASLTAAVTHRAASPGDIHIVEVTALDDNGRPCYLADNLISCFIRGGRLLGIENNDNRDMSAAAARERRLHEGRMTIYIAPDASAQSCDLFMTSPLLRGCLIIYVNAGADYL